MIFKGHAYRNLDDKGRLILPPEFRDIIRDNVPEGYIVLTFYRNQVVGITPAQWAHIEREVDAIKNPSDSLSDSIALLYSCYTETPVSKQGRISLSTHLRNSGNLDEKVAIMGVGKRFEIRPVDSIKELLGTKRDDSAEMADKNIDFGI